MSVMGTGASGQGTVPSGSGEPRVRDQAREAVVLMAFSAAVSAAVALLILVTYGMGR